MSLAWNAPSNGTLECDPGHQRLKERRSSKFFDDQKYDDVEELRIAVVPSPSNIGLAVPAAPNPPENLRHSP
jgi:hypothetical protein